MRLVMWRVCGNLLFILLIPASLLSGQSSTDIGAVAPPLVTRIERLQRHEDVCALVNREGQFRVERLYSAKTEVFAGKLSTADLEGLQQLLDSSQLKSLSQSQIPSVLLSDSEDGLTISTFREGALQQLAFPNPETRKPFRAALDPLLKWLEAVQKAQHIRLPESAANRCLPGAPITEAKPHSGNSNPPSPPHPGKSLIYLVRMMTDRAFNGTVSRTCIVVTQSGQYRMERVNHDVRGSHEARVFEDSVSTPDLENLRILLENPALVGLKSQPSIPFVPSLEAGVTILTIPRAGTIQQLFFTSHFNGLGHVKEPGGTSNMQYGVEKDAETVQPLRDWMRDTIEKNAHTPVKDSFPNDCTSVP